METSGSICGRFIHYGYKLVCREKVVRIFGDVAVTIENIKLSVNKQKFLTVRSITKALMLLPLQNFWHTPSQMSQPSGQQS